MKKVKALRIFNKPVKEKLLKKSFAILNKRYHKYYIFQNFDIKDDVLKILKKI